MLTTKFVATAKAGRHLDAQGLYLEVSPTGKKRWLLRSSGDGRSPKGSNPAEKRLLKEARETLSISI